VVASIVQPAEEAVRVVALQVLGWIESCKTSNENIVPLSFIDGNDLDFNVFFPSVSFQVLFTCPSIDLTFPDLEPNIYGTV